MWNAISDVGDAALTIPVAVTGAVWLALSDRALALRWILLLAAGMVLIGITKILYAGCGIEIASLGLRVISGHTTLSTAIWTVTIVLLCRGAGRSVYAGAAAGLLVGILTATARIFDHAHTVSEVIAGWLLGATVAVLFMRALMRSDVKLFRPGVAAVGLSLVTTIAYGHHAPFQAMIEEYSPGVCLSVSDGFLRWL